MDSETYHLLLKDPCWKVRRDEIIALDGGACVICGSRKALQVHHQWYVANRMPWDYEDDCLATLCKHCHADVHARADGRLEIGALRRPRPYVPISLENTFLKGILTKLLQKLGIALDV